LLLQLPFGDSAVFTFLALVLALFGAFVVDSLVGQWKEHSPSKMFPITPEITYRHSSGLLLTSKSKIRVVK